MVWVVPPSLYPRPETSFACHAFCLLSGAPALGRCDPPITIGVGAPTRGRPLVYRRILTDTSPESLSCALAHIACGLHSASAAVNTKLALQLVRAFAAYFRERAWPSLLMRGALAALSPCSWDLMPRHLCGRSILSDGASPPAAPSLFGSHPPSPWWHAKLSR